jgi:tight adherence protein B
MSLNASSVYLILVFAAVFSAVQAGIGLVRTATVKRRVNRRLIVAERVGGISELVIELRKQRGLSAAGERRGWRWLMDLILRSGVPYRPKIWAMAVAGGAPARARGGGGVLKKNPPPPPPPAGGGGGGGG